MYLLLPGELLVINKQTTRIVSDPGKTCEQQTPMVQEFNDALLILHFGQS